MSILIAYTSNAGSTKRYAQWLAQQVGATAVELKGASAETLQAASAVVYGGWVMASTISGLQKFNKLGIVPAAIFAVGLSDPTAEQEQQLRTANNIASDIPLFVLEGSLDYEQLGIMHRTMLKMIRKALSKKPDLNDSEKMMLGKLERTHDSCTPESLQPLVDLLLSK